MDIFEILKADHTEIRNLLNEVIDQTSVRIPKEKHDLAKPEDWEEALHDLKLALVAHDRAEERVLYSRFDPSTHLEGGKTHEHRLAEELLAEIEVLDPVDFEWGEKLARLRNLIESHQAEEEGSTFDLLRPEIDPTTSDRLAREFEALCDQFIEAPTHGAGRTRMNPAGLHLDR